MKKTFLALFLAVLFLSPLHVHGITNYWLIGYGGNYMLPFLDGGVLEYGVGQSIFVKVVGRNGYVTLFSPTGAIERIQLTDGRKTLLRKFGFADIGEWTVVNDEGYSVKAIVKPPNLMPTVTLYFSLENSRIVMRAQTPGQTFALFLEGRSDSVKAAGSTLRIGVRGFNETRVKAEIISSQQPIVYSGSLKGVGYGLEIEQLVSSEIVSGRLVNGSAVFSVKIPKEGEEVSGLKPIGVGMHKIRLSSLSTRNVVYEADFIIIPSSRRNLEGLSPSLTVDFWEAMEKNYTLVVGDETGTLWTLHIRPPAAVFRLYDVEHKRYHIGSDVLIADGSTKRIDNQFITLFMNTYEIVDYVNNSAFIPTRELVPTISFGAVTITSSPITVKSGDLVELSLSLYQAGLELIFPNGTVYHGPRTVEVNGLVYENVSWFFPRGVYTVRALRPESFSYETFVLTRDTTWTIIVLDNPLGLAGLRASSIILAALLVYTIFKTLRIRKTFN